MTATAYTPTTDQPITNYIPVLQTAPANVARFDYNPVTGESLGLLVEEQRTNLLTYSEDFSNAYWTKGNSSVTSNTIVAPDGLLTGDKIVENSSAGTHFVYNLTGQTITNNVTYSLSVYAKAAERTKLALMGFGSAWGGARRLIVDLTNGEVLNTANLVSSSVTNVGNGWYRISAIATATGTTASSGMGIYAVDTITFNGFGEPTYTGDGYSGIYIWGAQLEAGAFPTSYIKTEASQVTRSADSASMTGANFSSWYRADEGSIYSEFIPVVASSSLMLTLSDNTTSNRIIFSYTSNMLNANQRVVYNGVDQASHFAEFPTALQVGQSAKSAMAYKTNDFALVGGGATVATDTQGNVPVVDRLYIVAGFNGGASNLYLKKLSYYPARLSNTELQALTS